MTHRTPVLEIFPIRYQHLVILSNFTTSRQRVIFIVITPPKNPNLINQSFGMCLIRLRPDREEEVVVPNRPVRAELPPSRYGHSSHSNTALTTDNQRQQTSAPEVRSRDRIAPAEQAVIIEQISPRSSKLEIRRGFSYSYGDGPVAVGTQAKLSPNERTESQRSQRAAQVRRRSGSLVYAKSPRQSNASYRSTRERVVVVDDSGRRREYYRRDDSWR